VAAGAGAILLGALGVYFATGGSGGAAGLAVGQCGISITSPARARDGQLHLRSGQSLALSLAGTATRCPNTTLTRLFDDGGSASVTVDDAGTWTHSATVADGVTTTISVSSVDGGAAVLLVEAATSAPRVQVTAPTRDDWDAWRLVAPKFDAGCGGGGNIHAERYARAGYVSDADCADGGQLRASVTVTGASGGWLSVTWNGTPLVDAGIASSPATLTEAQLGTLTLPDLETGELAFTATTAGGVSTSLVTYATVRTLSPPALTGPDGGAPVASLLDARRASVQVDYVLPHVPVEIGAAHTEFVWTTSSVPCVGGGRAAGEACYSLEDGDAGFFAISNSTTNPAICGTVPVPDGGCAYASELIWVKTDGGWASARSTPGSGDRLGVAAITRSSTCAGAVVAVSPLGGCVSSIPRPAANAYTMSDGGGSTRDYWDSYYLEGGAARVLLASPVFDTGSALYPSSGAPPGGYLAARRGLQDCQLYDAEASPQEWRCAGGAVAYEGDVRRGVVDLPPLNSYVVIPVLAW
jgi:hypothetical protein